MKQPPRDEAQEKLTFIRRAFGFVLFMFFGTLYMDLVGYDRKQEKVGI